MVNTSHTNGGPMKTQPAFRPLLDFEKQIDEAFSRYNTKAKNNIKEFKLGIKDKKNSNVEKIAKFFGK